MDNVQVYLAIGVPIVFNGIMFTVLAVTSTSRMAALEARMAALENTMTTRFDLIMGREEPGGRSFKSSLPPNSKALIGTLSGRNWAQFRKREAQPHPLCWGLCPGGCWYNGQLPPLPTLLFLSCPVYRSGTGRRAPIWRSNWVARLLFFSGSIARSERSRRLALRSRCSIQWRSPVLQNLLCPEYRPQTSLKGV